jgi:hypothetical protein
MNSHKMRYEFRKVLNTLSGLPLSLEFLHRKNDTKRISFIVLLLCFLLGPQSYCQNHPLEIHSSNKVMFFADELWIPDNTYKGSFSNDFKTFYFLRKADAHSESYVPLFSIFIDGKWSEPTLMDFYDPRYSYTYQAIIPGTDKLVFCSNMPYSQDHSDNPNYSLWLKDLSNKTTEPSAIGPVNLLNKYNAQPSVTSDGTIYFMSIDENWRGRTAHFMTKKNNGYGQAVPFDVVNNWKDETNILGNFAMDPEQKFMIISMRSIEGDQWGQFDLYISYNRNNEWSMPKRLEIAGLNTERNEAFPYITHDGQFLMFTRDMSQFIIVPTRNFLTY